MRLVCPKLYMGFWSSPGSPPVVSTGGAGQAVAKSPTRSNKDYHNQPEHLPGHIWTCNCGGTSFKARNGTHPDRRQHGRSGEPSSARSIERRGGFVAGQGASGRFSSGAFLVCCFCCVLYLGVFALLGVLPPFGLALQWE